MTIHRLHLSLHLIPVLLGIGLEVSYCAGEAVPFLPEEFQRHAAVRDIAIAGDGKELYFTAQSLSGEVSVILRMEQQAGKWSRPQVASFSGQYKDLEPFLAPDGLKLYFVSTRPAGKADAGHEDFDIWIVERETAQDAWSAPVNLGPPVNTPGNEFYPAVTSGGDLYFTSDGTGSKGNDDIFYSKREGNGFGEPVSLSEAINSEGYEFNAYVAPDGSYLLFTGYNRPDGLGSGDLYISRKQADDTWSPAENLGPTVNSERMDYCPFVDTAKGILYFTSKRVDFPGQPLAIATVEDLLQITLSYANGQSRIYQVKDLPGLPPKQP